MYQIIHSSWLSSVKHSHMCQVFINLFSCFVWQNKNMECAEVWSLDIWTSCVSYQTLCLIVQRMSPEQIKMFYFIFNKHTLTHSLTLTQDNATECSASCQQNTLKASRHSPGRQNNYAHQSDTMMMVWSSDNIFYASETEASCADSDGDDCSSCLPAFLIIRDKLFILSLGHTPHWHPHLHTLLIHNVQSSKQILQLQIAAGYA